MPKVKVSNAKKIRSIMKDFKEFTITPKNKLYCLLCCWIVNHEKRFFVEQHVATLKHKKASKKQIVLESWIHNKCLKTLVNKNILPQNLFKFLHQVIYIPLVKLNHSAIQKIFQDLGQSVPSEILCLKFSETNDRKLVEDLSEKPLFFVINETELKAKTFCTYYRVLWKNVITLTCF